MVKVDFQKIFKPLVMFWPWHRSSSWYFCLRQCEWIKLQIIKKWDLVALVFHSENESCKASGTCLLPSKATSSSSFCCSLQTFQYLQAVTLHKYTSLWTPDGFSEFGFTFQKTIFKSNQITFTKLGTGSGVNKSHIFFTGTPIFEFRSE